MVIGFRSRQDPHDLLGRPDPRRLASVARAP
jgi:hypothetical protein